MWIKDSYDLNIRNSSVEFCHYLALVVLICTFNNILLNLCVVLFEASEKLYGGWLFKTDKLLILPSTYVVFVAVVVVVVVLVFSFCKNLEHHTLREYQNVL